MGVFSALQIFCSIGVVIYLLLFIAIGLNWKKFKNKYFLFCFFNVICMPLGELIQDAGLDYTYYVITAFPLSIVGTVDRVKNWFENYARLLAHVCMSLDRFYAVYFFATCHKLQCAKVVILQLVIIYGGSILLVLPVAFVPNFYQFIPINESDQSESLDGSPYVQENTTASGFYNIGVGMNLIAIMSTAYIMIIKRIHSQKTRAHQVGANADYVIDQAERTEILQAGITCLFQIHYVIVSNSRFAFDPIPEYLEKYRDVAEWVELMAPPFVFFGCSETLRNTIVPACLRKKPTPVFTITFRTNK